MSELQRFSTQIVTDALTGGSHPSVALVFDSVRTGAPDHYGILSGWQFDELRKKLLKAGISPENTVYTLLSEFDENSLPPGCVVVGFGESVLRTLTEKKSVDKWNMSPLRTKGGRTFVPTFDLSRINKQYDLNLYLSLALLRAKEFSVAPPTPPEERFFLNPGLEETHSILEMLLTKPEVAVDVETGYGQINTVGFAWSPSDAIAINVLPARCGDGEFHRLWMAIARILESPDVGKIFQNFIYDTSYFSAYGIQTNNITHDTMHGMKVLWPELDMNLGNVGRIYTRRPYWKDDGKVEGEEGKKKDWGNVRDWTKHYIYNARDCTGTFEAAQSQRSDLVQRGLDTFFDNYIKKLINPAREMCAVGFPVSESVRGQLLKETEEKITSLTEDFQKEVGSELNPSSPVQVGKYLKGLGITLPKKYDKATGAYKETTDANAIKKIRLKHPDRRELALLQDIKALDKALSSYIDFEPRPDGRLSYSLNITGTETLRWSGGKDGWDRGFNIQTIPREGGEVSIKSMFVAPEGHSLVEVDLRQAESRFVAYDSADKTLIDMLESGADVHSHVGNAILRQMGRDPSQIPKEEFKKTWRQLGKKAGHGLNYGMKARVFVETVFNELDMVISVKDAENITAAYYGLFPGIPRWHKWVGSELYSKRKLSAPSGWERYFYGRYDDALKEAMAWRPQHTIPWITNCLMLHLCDLRKHDRLKFRLLTQVHDALYMEVKDDQIEAVAKVCLDHPAWHPEVNLPGGRMFIPTEVKVGKVLSEAEEYHA